MRLRHLVSSALGFAPGVSNVAIAQNALGGHHGAPLDSMNVAERLKRRSLHSPGNSIWIPYGLGGFHPPVHGFHMDYFLAGSPAIFSFHTHYEFHMDCPWNTPFHMDSMHRSMWIPYGFHGISNEF